MGGFAGMREAQGVIINPSSAPHRFVAEVTMYCLLLAILIHVTCLHLWRASCTVTQTSMPTERSAQMRLYVRKRHLYFCDKSCNFTYRLNNKRLLYTCIKYWYFWVSYKIITSVEMLRRYSYLGLFWTSMQQYYNIWARNYNASLELRKTFKHPKNILPEPTYIWKYQIPPPRVFLHSYTQPGIPGAPVSQIKLAWWKKQQKSVT